VLLAAALLLICHSDSMTRGAGAGSAVTISDLAWMVGNWQTEANGRFVSDEHWTAPAGGSMIGMSRTVAGEKMVSFEYLRVEQRGTEVFYVASPKGRCPATDFKLTRTSAKEAVFENPEHDFPKRIIYKRTAEAELTASIDGGEGTKSESFVFHRISDK